MASDDALEGVTALTFITGARSAGS
jgi:hypothetical protein